MVAASMSSRDRLGPKASARPPGSWSTTFRTLRRWRLARKWLSDEQAPDDRVHERRSVAK